MKAKPVSPRSSLNRRDFLRATALAAGAATLGVPALVRGQNLNSKVNVAAVGIGGKGASDVYYSSRENIVALCDVDKDYSARTVSAFPAAKFYTDYRKMLDEMGKSIDAVIVATPDHWHALIAAAAMNLGKHVYVQKPLTQTIFEARQLRDLAQAKKLVTQMGNQGSADDGLRFGVECIQGGVVGDVHEVHIWTNRPIWPQGYDRPAGTEPVPPTLDWDLWLGPAPERPYRSRIYQPFVWRGWQDYGTGALGDMACHTVNLAFRGLKLGYPTTVEATTTAPMNKEMYPLGSKIRFDFPARESMPAVTLYWYDGGKPIQRTSNNDPFHDGSNKPPRDITTDIEGTFGEVPGSGCLIVGDKGKIFSPDDYGVQSYIKLKDDPKFLFFKKHPAAMAIKPTLPRNAFNTPGLDMDARHHLEWLAAIKDNKPETCYSRFDITANLTEIMLLGCVSLRCGKKIEWDGPSMTAKNAPEAAQYIKRTNRAGWSV
jgi:predicted dehydrogenase